MNALPVISIPLLQRPEYDNRQLHSFAAWYSANEKALAEYYNDLREWGDGEMPDFFSEFCPVQHETELERV